METTPGMVCTKHTAAFWEHCGNSLWTLLSSSSETGSKLPSPAPWAADGSEYFQVVAVLLLLSILESVREVKEDRTLGEDEKREGKLKGLVAAENSQRGTKFKEQVTSMWYNVLSWGRDAFVCVYNNVERWNPLWCFHTGFRCLLIASPSSLILYRFLLVPSFGCGIQPTQTFEDHITYSKAPDLPSLRFPGPLLFLRPGA